MNSGAIAAIIISVLVGIASAQPQTQPQQPPSSSRTAGTFTDARDGKKYKTVTIGKQTWMAENLNHQPKSGGSWCYGNDSSNCGKYGRLYGWNTALTVCPSGFRLPSLEDWDTLRRAVGGGGFGEVTVGGISPSGTRTWRGIGEKLKARSGWHKDGNGTDEYGFAALPGGSGGIKSDSMPHWFGPGNIGRWWTATKYLRDGAYNNSSPDREWSTEYRIDGAYTWIMIAADHRLELDPDDKDIGHSVRCIADGAARPVPEPPPVNYGSLRDARDGKTYRTVKIGKQTWMAQNLNHQPKSGNSRCYKDDSSNCAKYGRLYDFKTALTVCPSGFRLPSREDWDSLGQAAGGSRMKMNIMGGISWSGAGAKLKAGSGWQDKKDGSNGNGIDDYGFSALPGGRRHADGKFTVAGYFGYWWTAAEMNGSNAYDRIMNYNEDDMDESSSGRDYYLAVRCVEGAAAQPAQPSKIGGLGTFTDTRDGKTYNTAVIGGKKWMAENLNYQTSSGSWCYNNGDSYCRRYGRLYDFQTAAAACPSGFRLPLREDWDELALAIGAKRIGTEKFAWSDAGNKMKATSGWINKDDGKSGGGTDDYGFSALPGGTRVNTDGSFHFIGENGLWWTATESGSDSGHLRVMDNNAEFMSEFNGKKVYSVSVRCVSGPAPQPVPAPKPPPPVKYGSLRDARDGKTYRTVKIGKQTWMAENLNHQPKSGNSWCYGNDTSNCGKYGRLYDFHTTLKVCPTGFHLPSAAEWSGLISAAGGGNRTSHKTEDGAEFFAWDDAGKNMKARDGWNVADDGGNGNGTDGYGFSALPGGSYDDDGTFSDAGEVGYWWSVMKHGSGLAGLWTMNSSYDHVLEIGIGKNDSVGNVGYSVRCVADK